VGPERSQAVERRSPNAKASFCGVMTSFNEKRARGLDRLRKLYCHNKPSGKARSKKEKQQRRETANKI